MRKRQISTMRPFFAVGFKYASSWSGEVGWPWVGVGRVLFWTFSGKQNWLTAPAAHPLLSYQPVPACLGIHPSRNSGWGLPIPCPNFLTIEQQPRRISSAFSLAFTNVWWLHGHQVTQAVSYTANGGVNEHLLEAMSKWIMILLHLIGWQYQYLGRCLAGKILVL